MDFGIARILADVASHLTAEGTVTGTLRYMAPEQLRGDEVGPATDVYATGVLLTEMLTGEPPYQGTTAVEVRSDGKNWLTMGDQAKPRGFTTSRPSPSSPSSWRVDAPAAPAARSTRACRSATRSTTAAAN